MHCAAFLTILRQGMRYLWNLHKINFHFQTFLIYFWLFSKINFFLKKFWKYFLKLNFSTPGFLFASILDEHSIHFDFHIPNHIYNATSTIPHAEWLIHDKSLLELTQLVFFYHNFSLSLHKNIREVECMHIRGLILTRRNFMGLWAARAIKENERN